MLECYNRIVENVELSGPTNFAPLIKEAIKIVESTKQVNINLVRLVIELVLSYYFVYFV